MTDALTFDDGAEQPSATVTLPMTPDQLLAALGDEHPVFKLLTSQQTALASAQQQVERMVRLVIAHAEAQGQVIDRQDRIVDKLATKHLELVELSEALLDGRAARDREDREAAHTQEVSEKALGEIIPLAKLVVKSFLSVPLAPDELGNGLDDFFNSVTPAQWDALIEHNALGLNEPQRLALMAFLEAKAARDEERGRMKQDEKNATPKPAPAAADAAKAAELELTDEEREAVLAFRRQRAQQEDSDG